MVLMVMVTIRVYRERMTGWEGGLTNRHITRRSSKGETRWVG